MDIATQPTLPETAAPSGSARRRHGHLPPQPGGLPAASHTTGASVIGRQLWSFAMIGVVSTMAYAALYALLRQAVSPIVANAAALLVTAVGNTAANRRLTFSVRGGGGLVRDHLGGLLAFGMALAITSGSISALALVAPAAGRAVELTVLVVSNAAATIVRFLVLRTWIDQPARQSAAMAPRLERTPR
jgi:putative flippase GtrA